MKPVYGIDFGTTNSSIAVMRYNSLLQTSVPYVIPVEPNQSPDTVLKSLAALGADGSVTVGHRAGALHALPPGTFPVRSVKRSLGNPKAKYIAGSKFYSPSDVAGFILRELKRRADERLPEPGEGAVIGVPVGFDDKQKDALLGAAILAGIVPNARAAEKQIRFVAEPVAVALSYGIELRSDQKVMVFDFGGGTLDLTIMDMRYIRSPGELRPNDVLAKGGDNLGGDDVDMLILQQLIALPYGEAKLKQRLGISDWGETTGSATGWRLLERVEQRKRDLSDLHSARLDFFEGGLELEVELTRENLQRQMAPMLQRIEQLVRQTLASAEQGRRPVAPRDIDLVILAGGSSLIPAVRERLSDIFGGSAKIMVHANPLTSIADGLARATEESTESRPLLNDITDFNYGLWDHARKEVAVIIPAGTRYRETLIDVPARKGISEQFNATNSNSDHLIFEIRETRGVDRQGRLLHTVRVPITRGPINPNRARFEVFFEVDPDKGWFSLKVYDHYEGDWIEPPTDSEFRTSW